jgi:hypothetical protein
MINYEVFKHVPEHDENDVVNYMVYSHTEFLDLLAIQIDHLKGRGHLTLCINSNDLEIDDVYENFDHVVFYDGSLTYGQKLLSCMNQVDYEYVLFLHDIDILFDADDTKILELLYFLKKNSYDRVDFQLAYDFNSTHRDTIEDDDLYLIKSSNTDTRAQGYPFNVQPSIWKRDTLIEILTKFSYLDYRTIEQDAVQEFAVEFNIFKLFAKKSYRCGYLTCLEPFKYLHLTHGRQLFSPKHVSFEDSVDIIDAFNIIVDKYDLKNSKRWKN